jgi:hypothetical protein
VCNELTCPVARQTAMNRVEDLTRLPVIGNDIPSMSGWSNAALDRAGAKDLDLHEPLSHIALVSLSWSTPLPGLPEEETSGVPRMKALRFPAAMSALSCALGVWASIAFMLGFLCLSAASAETMPYHSEPDYICWKYPLTGVWIISVRSPAVAVSADAAKRWTSDYTYWSAGGITVGTSDTDRETGDQQIAWRAKFARWDGSAWVPIYPERLDPRSPASGWLWAMGAQNNLGQIWDKWTGTRYIPASTFTEGSFLSAASAQHFATDAHYDFPVYTGTYWVGHEIWWGDFAGSTANDWVNRLHSHWIAIVHCGTA